MSENRVKVERLGAVAHVRLNRPEKRNGLDLAMFEAIVDAGEALARDASLRAVVLSGEGKAFCAGLDWGGFMAAPETASRLLARPEGRPDNLAQRVAWVWRDVPVPVIAAVHGAAYGGGLQIALGADYRIAHPEAQLSVMEIRYGLVPDMGASRTLLGLVRPDVAKELTFTGRIVSGTEAVALGLATRLADDPIAAALEAAEGMAQRSPHALRSAKALYERAPSLDLHAAFALETELQVALLGSRNQMEAVQAQLEKRAPRFEDAG